jgi:hypothetical protein
MRTHVRRWKAFYEQLLARPLVADDYMFPMIATNGVIYCKTPISHDTVTKHLTTFTKSVGLTGKFSTHCFRRGGAQYRFMFAPLGQRWSLTVIRWWGGWAEGEHVSIELFLFTICYRQLMLTST